MRPIGIDISKYDLRFDPQGAEAQPAFVIQRAGYGIVRDQAFDALYEGVRKVAVRGAYHYLNSGVSWRSQADHFLEWVAGRDFQFYACDFEGAYNVVDLTFVGMAMEWMRYVHEQSGRPVVLYSNSSIYQEWLGRDSRAAQWPLWIAQYPYFMPDAQTANPKMPKGRQDWLFWQFSPGEKNGLGARYGVGARGVDLNVFNGSYDDLLAWAGVSQAADGQQTVRTLEERVAALEERVSEIESRIGG